MKRQRKLGKLGSSIKSIINESPASLVKVEFSLDSNKAHHLHFMQRLFFNGLLIMGGSHASTISGGTSTDVSIGPERFSLQGHYFGADAWPMELYEIGLQLAQKRAVETR